MDNDDNEGTNLLINQDAVAGGVSVTGGGGEDRGASGVIPSERSTLPQRHRLVDATERVAALGTTNPNHNDNHTL